MPATDSVKSYQSIPPANDEISSKPIARNTILAYGGLRAVAGTGLIIAPMFVCKLFHIPVTASTALIARAVGARDLIMGELLLTADQTSKDRKEVKRALWANVAADAADIGAVAWALSTGQLTRTGAGLFGGGAAAFVLLGLLGLRSLN